MTASNIRYFLALLATGTLCSLFFFTAKFLDRESIPLSNEKSLLCFIFAVTASTTIGMIFKKPIQFWKGWSWPSGKIRPLFIAAIVLGIPPLLSLPLLYPPIVPRSLIVDLPLLYIALFIKNLPVPSAAYASLAFFTALLAWNKKMGRTEKTILGINILVSSIFVAFFLLGLAYWLSRKYS